MNLQTTNQKNLGKLPIFCEGRIHIGQSFGCSYRSHWLAPRTMHLSQVHCTNAPCIPNWLQSESSVYSGLESPWIPLMWQWQQTETGLWLEKRRSNWDILRSSYVKKDIWSKSRYPILLESGRCSRASNPWSVAMWSSPDLLKMLDGMGMSYRSLRNQA